MPTYEYECLECKHKFDVFQSINDEPVKTCQSCGGKVRKLFSNAGIIFKGSGFYVNDYKTGSSSGKSDSASSPCSSCNAADGCASSSSND